jgi:L-ascorbate metabolism protein UlaG (beta-lactamase superfamily)
VHGDGERRKEATGDVIDEEKLRVTVVIQRHASPATDHDVLEDRHVLLDVPEFLVREHSEAIIRGHERDADESIRIRDRQGTEVDGVEQAKHRTRRADTDAQSDDREQDVSWLMEQNADRAGEVLHDVPLHQRVGRL